MTNKKEKKPRIFIGLIEVAGYCTNLKKGFDELGINTTYINLYGHPFGYEYVKHENIIIRATEYVGKRCASAPSNPIFLKLFWFFLFQIIKIPLFIFCLFKFDVFIFSFKTTFFYNQLDIPILSFFNKRLIFPFLGSDSRPPYINGSVLSNTDNIDLIIKLTKRQKKAIKKIEKYADYIINSPPQGLFHERSFISHFEIGIPFSFKNEIKEQTNKAHNQIIILHSPSKPKAKGTQIIEQVINELIKEGFNIELVTIKNMPNSVVIEKLKQCDFIVDQVYSDTPLAGFATEAAFFKKPAVVSGYYAKQFIKEVPEKIRPISIFCEPCDLKKAIIKLSTDNEYRESLGIKAHQFVTQNWKPQRVANKYLKIINNKTEDFLIHHPEQFSYFLGACADKELIRETIQKMIERAGVSSLCLDDKPELLANIISFANEK